MLGCMRPIKMAQLVAALLCVEDVTCWSLRGETRGKMKSKAESNGAELRQLARTRLSSDTKEVLAEYRDGSKYKPDMIVIIIFAIQTLQSNSSCSVTRCRSALVPATRFHLVGSNTPA